MTSNIIENINIIFSNYKNKFLKLPKEIRLTEYEKAIGFTEITRIGSKQFANQFGYFMEDIYNLSPKFKKIKNKCSNDSENKFEYFECKNRYNTMKQSLVIKEIQPKLELAIKENKNFKLLILIDKKFISRDIPLHEGFGLKKIKFISGYDSNKHKWISGDKIYEYLFDDYNYKIKNTILNLLSTTYN